MAFEVLEVAGAQAHAEKAKADAEKAQEQMRVREELLLGWLRMLVLPGQITELRALNMQFPSGSGDATFSGYYDYDHLIDMVRHAISLSDKQHGKFGFPSGIYFTINPLLPDLLALRKRRYSIVGKGEATKDKHVTDRNWMLVDIDPERIADISSTDAEKLIAKETAVRVMSHLGDDLGWPSPIVVDSGNGYHLYYRVSLPADDGGLISNVLYYLADRFDIPDKVKIDPTVANAARISKIPGTMSRKGDSTIDRPHRVAVLKHCPDGGAVVVPTESLQALAEIWKKKKSEQKDVRSKGLTLDSRERPKSQKAKKSIVDRARAYLAAIPPAISENAGGRRTYEVACHLVRGFALSINDAFPLIAEWNQSCVPPWTDSELTHKLESALSNSNEPMGGLLEAKQAPKRRDDDSVTNATVVSTPDGGKEIIPLPMGEIIDSITAATNEDLRRVGPSLFYHQNGTPDPVYWIKSPDALFGMIATLSDSSNPHFYRNVGCLSRAEVMAELQRFAPSFESIETTPHEPMMENHYYACPPIEPGDGSRKHIDWLLSRYNFETVEDRELGLAYFLMPLWGGPPGTRPLCIVTSKHGQGVGKTTFAEDIASLYGGSMKFSLSDSGDEIKKRLLSVDGRSKRITILDNQKTNRFSSADIEEMLTSRSISGKQLYAGEGSRPNNISWFATINGLAASRDIAQRSLILHLNKATHSGTWLEETTAYIQQHRHAILGDLIEILRGPRNPLTKSSRWGKWENDVLSRLSNPDAVQGVYLERQQSVDADTEDSDVIIDLLKGKINGWLLFHEYQRVFIPSTLMERWVFEATAEKRTTAGTSRFIKQKIADGSIPQLIENKDRRQGGRGFIWCLGETLVDIGYNGHGSPDASEQVYWDILEYISRQKAEANEQKAIDLAVKTHKEIEDLNSNSF